MDATVTLSADATAHSVGNTHDQGTSIFAMSQCLQGVRCFSCVVFVEAVVCGFSVYDMCWQ